MENEYKLSPVTGIPAYIDERGIDICDPKWSHPELAPWYWGGDRQMAANFMNYRRDPETVKSEQEELDRQMLGKNGRKDEREWPSGVYLKTYYGHGCPEEPDTQVRVEVTYPKGYDPSTSHYVMFNLLGGGLWAVYPNFFPIPQWCESLNCPIITPIYRSANEAKYPAAINDVHAGYLWMIEHAEELGFDLDKVVIYGQSTGGHLGACLAFRLKRYGWPGGMPRGVIAYQPQLDDNCKFHSARYRNNTFDGEQLRWSALNYLGPENYCSPILGPESYANHATVEECKGLCPFFIHGGAMDVDTGAELEFVGKLIENDVYVQYILWGGQSHGSLMYATLAPVEGAEQEEASDMGKMIDMPARKIPEGGYSIVDRFAAERKGEFLDCIRYDFRRPWLTQE